MTYSRVQSNSCRMALTMTIIYRSGLKRLAVTMSLPLLTEGLSLQIKASALHSSLPWTLDGLGETLALSQPVFPSRTLRWCLASSLLLELSLHKSRVPELAKKV